MTLMMDILLSKSVNWDSLEFIWIIHILSINIDNFASYYRA